VFEFSADYVGPTFGSFYGIRDASAWREGFQEGLLNALIERPSQHHNVLRPAGLGALLLAAGPVPLNPAQQAVEDVLLTAVGSQPLGASSGQTAVNGKLSTATLAQISAAARRFAAMPASARHAWLAVHLTALRAGTITLAQIP
jgi:hypothetical protein